MKGMSLIVKKVAQLMAGPVFLYGIYIISHGHLTPGGGFAGGVILAGALILLVLAFGSDMFRLQKREEGTSIVESSGILAFLLIPAVAIFLGTNIFFVNYLPKGTVGALISAGVIPLYNIVVGIEVAAGIFTIFLALVIYKEESGK
jgi:multisubunit Na+/H+ antiporter MnhB subunit